MTKPTEFSVGEIFTHDDYIIPLYQRNYAWDQAQVTQLIRDIWDFKDGQTSYYIGTLVVYKRETDNKLVYETIDGQQRLTTLNILLSVLKNNFNLPVGYRYESKLKFDSREVSSDTLKLLADQGKTNNQVNYNTRMQQAYLDMTKELNLLSNRNKASIKTFSDYLLNKVRILRVEVPPKTDLNHYFEIMNNRGEQLEKHEILKAEFLSHLKKLPDSSKTFAMIWDACSNMERYMVLEFKRELRDALFLANDKTWDYFPKNFEEIKTDIKSFSKSPGKSQHEVNFLNLVEDQDRIPVQEAPETDDDNTRFNSVINFPNFLLQILRVFTLKDMPLDDKRLITTFKAEIEAAPNKIKFVKDFAYALLRDRFMFDRYVIKREFTQNGDGWSLKGIRLSKDKKNFYYVNSFEKDSKKNTQAIMLLAMFHVSFPQIIYKHWLSGVLLYLQNNGPELDVNEYIKYLEKLSNAFYFDRFGEQELDYYKIIFTNKANCQNRKIKVNTYLHQGTDVQNFIFNRLDYLIWKSEVTSSTPQFNIDNIHHFEFSFRTSVEHYYPQHPKPGAGLKFDVSSEKRDHFGNLCLISRSKNSELSNYSPLAKAEHYSKSSIIESLKQRLMMRKKDSWDETAIEEHQNEMIELLERY